MPETEELVRRAKDGDQAAFLELVRRYEPLVKRIILQCGAGEEQDDLRQESMIALYAAVVSYKSEQGVTFGAYAKACMRNRILNITRKQKKEKQIEEAILPDEEADPARTLITKDAYRMLLSPAAFGLTELERQVLQLYLADMSYGQIAASLQITEKSVDNAIYRMKSKMRKHM